MVFLNSFQDFIVAQWAKDLVLSLRWLESLLWPKFSLSPGTSICHGRDQKKKKVSRGNSK